MLACGRDQGRTTGAALGSCDGHIWTRNANGRGILNIILNMEPSRFGVALEPLEIASKFGRSLVAQFAILLQQLADDVDGGPEGMEEEERADYYADPSASARVS